ncbi:MAG: 1,6-anhydro-N-acetylmuramyl-L-alanine amidase AmpD [Burkholderiaceae bacterium]|jgi:AmpD protein|nr:1,6-anhydro-N-acetylmuramyl-L-alanine amidase AmpD [Burkholderiaceae bacterium]
MTTAGHKPARGDRGDLWRGGWYRPAQRQPSPNFGPRPAGADISLIVLHSISLPPGVYGGVAVLDLFGNRLDWDAHPYFQTLRGLQVSAHFFIRRGGQIIQCVSGDERAWHAGASCWRGRANCNDYAIGIELEGLEGQPFAAPQYAALARLTADLARHYPIAAIAGHEHVAPGRKRDPGAGFDWARLQRQLMARLDRPLDWPRMAA